MHIAVDPAQRPTDGTVLFFTLMVRGASLAGTSEAALEFMTGAHDHLSRSFNELTRDAMDDMWGRGR